MTCHKRGFSLPELLTSIAIIGMMLVITTISFTSITRRRAMRAAAAEIRTVFRLTRSQAVTRGRNVAIKFKRVGDDWHYATYIDGNWNGVRNAEITSGKDPLLTPFRKVLQGTGVGRIGFPPRSVPDPDTGRPLPPSASPVRFNQSTLCSFSAMGEATNGSIFLTDGYDNVGMVRVYGPDPRYKLFTFERATGKWVKR